MTPILIKYSLANKKTPYNSVTVCNTIIRRFLFFTSGKGVIGDGVSGSFGMPKEPLTPSPMTPFPLVKNKKRRIIVLQTVTLLYGVFLLAREYFIRIGVKTMKK